MISTGTVAHKSVFFTQNGRFLINSKQFHEKNMMSC